jgi:hypothetical protein
LDENHSDENEPYLVHFPSTLFSNFYHRQISSLRQIIMKNLKVFLSCFCLLVGLYFLSGDVEKFIQDVENCFRRFKEINSKQNLTFWNFTKQAILETFGTAEVSLSCKRAGWGGAGRVVVTCLFFLFMFYSSMKKVLLMRMMKRSLNKERKAEETQEENQHLLCPHLLL